MNTKILFYTIGTKIMPSTRARIYIYEDLIKQEGFTYKIIHAVNNFFCKARIEGRRNNSLIKPFFSLYVLFRLIIFMLHVPFYKYIIVQKVLFPVALLPIIHQLFKNKICYFDMDDIIYRYHQEDNKTAEQEEILKLKFKKNMSLYSRLITSTEYLKSDIIKTNDLPDDFIYKIHDPIDAEYFKSSKERMNKIPVIGWNGTPSNTVYLLECLPDIIKLRKQGYKFELSFVGINKEMLNKKFGNNLDADIKKWTLDKEKEYYDEIDIGLMPIPDDEWSKAKGGYKCMLYMSMGKISVASNVGINSNIITNKKNGFLVSSDQDWLDTIKYILDNYDKMDDLRKEARNCIIENYSLNILGEQFLILFKGPKV